MIAETGGHLPPFFIHSGPSPPSKGFSPFFYSNPATRQTSKRIPPSRGKPGAKLGGAARTGRNQGGRGWASMTTLLTSGCGQDYALASSLPVPPVKLACRHPEVSPIAGEKSTGRPGVSPDFLQKTERRRQPARKSCGKDKKATSPTCAGREAGPPPRPTSSNPPSLVRGKVEGRDEQEASG